MSNWDPDSDFVFQMPTRILAGTGAHREIASEVAELGCSRALIVTDHVLRQHTGIPAMIEEQLGSSCAGIFDGVEPDSSIDIVDSGAAIAQEAGADCLVSVGGGSSIDTAKSMSIVMTNGGSIRDHLAVNALSGPQTPHIAVPTTAGTGSEVIHVALVKDPAAHTKFIVLDTRIFPSTAILDPMLTTGLPASLTAATALDAVTHAVEAITSIYRNPVSESLAIQAISMIDAALLRAIESPGSVEHRAILLNAATMAGAAFTNAMVGLVHAIAHALGGVCGVHHGLANAIMLPHVIRFNAQTVPELYQPVAAALGLADDGAHEAALHTASHLERLATTTGIVTTLREAGVERGAFDLVAQKAMADGAIINNCRPVTGESEVIGLLEDAWE